MPAIIPAKPALLTIRETGAARTVNNEVYYSANDCLTGLYCG